MISKGNTRAPGIATTIANVATNPLATTIPIPGLPENVVPNTDITVDPVASFEFEGRKVNAPHYNPDTQT